jgi:hypothetical protein
MKPSQSPLLREIMQACGRENTEFKNRSQWGFPTIISVGFQHRKTRNGARTGPNPRWGFPTLPIYSRGARDTQLVTRRVRTVRLPVHRHSRPSRRDQENGGGQSQGWWSFFLAHAQFRCWHRCTGNRPSATANLTMFGRLRCRRSLGWSASARTLLIAPGEFASGRAALIQPRGLVQAAFSTPGPPPIDELLTEAESDYLSLAGSH